MVVVFVLGTPAIDEHRTQQMIQREHELYHDIVQENFVDTYRNLTYKAVAWLKWTTKYCAHPPFMLKVRAWVHSTRKMRVQIDDDVLVNPFVLVRHLKHMQKTGYGAKNTISCLRWDKVQVRSAHECAQAALAQVVRNKKSKWYVSESEYAGQVYPPYCSGSAWVFSMDLVPRMLNASYTQPFFWIDDFYITGSLAVAVGARFNQMRSLYTVTGYDADLATHERRLLNDRAVFGHFPKSKTQLMWPLWKQILRQYT
jgi:beta-1,3-galactosyltransferase 1